MTGERGLSLTMATPPGLQPQAPSASPPTSLTIRDSNLAQALSALQTTPATKLSAVRTLRITFTESNLLHWHGSLWPGVRAAFDDDDLDEYARLYPAPTPALASSPNDPRPSSAPSSQAFRALMHFVAENFDLGNLDLEVDAGSAAWSLFEDKGAGAYGGDEVDEDWRFVYELYLDVGRALTEAFWGKELRRVVVKTSIWDGMGPWLAGQITGGVRTVNLGRLPGYHDATSRLVSGKGRIVDGKRGVNHLNKG